MDRGTLVQRLRGGLERSARAPRPRGDPVERPRALASFLLPVALLVAALADRTVLQPDLDVDIYRQYADAILKGPLAHGLPHEYPALAGFLFTIPRVLGLPYAAGFSLIMAIALVALIWAGRMFGEAWMRRTVAYLTLSVFGILLFRFDLLVALTILLSVRSARESNWRSAWAWALLGGFLKVTPLLLLPGFFIIERREGGRWPLRRVFISAAIGLSAAAVQALLAPGTLLNPVRYELHRGFEQSSLPGTVTLLTSPAHLRFVYQFHNIQVIGGLHSTIALAAAVLGATGMLAVWFTAYRRSLSVEAASLAILTVAILTSKSFAPQYLMWLAPLWALWRLRPTWMIAAGLSTIIYPMLSLIALHAGWRLPLYQITVVAAFRNLAFLIGSTLWWRQELRASALRPASRSLRNIASSALRVRWS